MRIPDEKIEDVRQAADIVEVISASIALKKRGKSYLGLCPFHQEKTPSFSVSPDKQMFYCFGCGVGGNVFTFVMNHEKVSFIEAVRTLAARFGVTLPAEGAADRVDGTENEALYAVCRQVSLFYHDTLMTSLEGKLPLEYFRHRGFTDVTIQKFCLGYSPNAWDGVVKFAEREHFDIAVLEKAGLIVRREDGTGVYDRFRGRAMFPIFSSTGRTIAFGARKMRDDDPLGKYINSPETPIYNKSRVLYGLSLSKEAIREKGYAVLVEGYADLISVFQGGIENIVASSGTALTVEQIQLIGRYAKDITLVYDADSAGSRATIRGVDLVIENDLDVKVAELPAGDDPDSFVRKHGAQEFQRLLESAVSFLDFKAKLFRQEGLFATPEGKTRAVRSFVDTIAKMRDELKRNFYIQRVAEQYDIYASVLYRELEKVLGQQETFRRQERVRETRAVPRPVDAASASGALEKPLLATERSLLKVMVEGGTEFVQFVFSHLSLDHFTAPAARSILQKILAYVEHGESWDANRLLDDLADEHLKGVVANIVFTRDEISKGWDSVRGRPADPDPWQIAKDAIILMKQQGLDALLTEAYSHMKQAELRGEDLIPIQQQIHALQQEKKNLRTLWGKPA